MVTASCNRSSASGNRSCCRLRHMSTVDRCAFFLFSNFTLVTFRTIERLLNCRAHVAITVAYSLRRLYRRSSPGVGVKGSEMHVLATCKTLGNSPGPGFGIDLTARRRVRSSVAIHCAVPLHSAQLLSIAAAAKRPRQQDELDCSQHSQSHCGATKATITTNDAAGGRQGLHDPVPTAGRNARAI